MQEKLNALKLDALRELAKSHGLTGYATMRKAELIAALEETAARSAENEAPSEKKTGKSSKAKPASKKETASGETDSPKKDVTKASKETKSSEAKEASKEPKASSKEEAAVGRKKVQKETVSKKTASSQEATSAEVKTSSRKKKGSEESASKENVSVETTPEKDAKPAKETVSKKRGSAKKKEVSEETLTPIEEVLKEQESRKESETKANTSKKQKNSPAAEEEPDNAERTAAKAESTPNKEPASSEESPLPAAEDSEIPAPEEHRPQRTLPKPNTHGKLDIMASGYGFIRSTNPETGVKRDVYIANSFIRKFNLKSGDIITGNSHPTSRFDAIFYITAINGISPMDLMTGKRHASSEANDSASSEGSSDAATAPADGAEPKEGVSEIVNSNAPSPESESDASVRADASVAKEVPERTEGSSSPLREEHPGNAPEGSNGMEEGSEEAGRDFSQSQGNDYHSRMETREIEGVYEIMPDGYGFLRCNNYIPSDQDIFVSPATIRRLNLKDGDYIKGVARVTERFDALIKIYTINGLEVDSEEQVRAFRNRIPFENLTPIFPNERIHLENPSAPHQIATRIIDLVSPIGKGQRGMIVSPPKAGKTTLLKQIARSIQTNHPEIHLIVLLIDERPEEVTDMKESIGRENSEVVYSTFDKEPDNHCRVSEMVIERAKRLVEAGKDVVILLDSITRLARAYNLVCDPSGRTLSGGLDPTALLMPKRFFGAARNMREGGSLTVLATALVDTGSRMDDVVFEEFKGTGNMEIVLDRSLSERRIFPAIDILKSGTRREDLLLTNVEAAAMNVIRRSTNVARQEEAVEHILQMFSRTDTNRDFLVALNQMYKRGSLS